MSLSIATGTTDLTEVVVAMALTMTAVFVGLVVAVETGLAVWAAFARCRSRRNSQQHNELGDGR